MALDATINLLEEQNSVLGDIQNLLRKDQETQSRKRLEEKEKTDEQIQLFRDLLNAVRGAAGMTGAQTGGGGSAAGGAPSTGGLVNIGGKIGSIFTAISTGFLAVTKVFEKIKGFITGKGGIGKIAKNILKFLGKVFAVFAVFKGIYDGWKEYEKTGSIAEALSTGIGSIVDTLFGWIPKALAYILDFVGAPEWLTDALRDFDLAEATKGFIDGLVVVVTDAFKFIAGKLSFLGDRILEAFGFATEDPGDLSTAPTPAASGVVSSTGMQFKSRDFFIKKAESDFRKQMTARGKSRDVIEAAVESARGRGTFDKMGREMFNEQLARNAGMQQPIVINNNVDASSVSQNVQTNVGMATEAVEKTAPRRRSSFKATPYGL